jgi:MFS family permease
MADEKRRESMESVKEIPSPDMEQNAGGGANTEMTFRRFMVLLSLVWLVVTSATPLLFITATLCKRMDWIGLADILAYTVADIGGAASVSWLGTASTLAIAAVAPFAGAISDLIGRRYVGLLADVFIIVGMIIVGCAQHMGVAIAGITLVGIGGGLAELVAFAGIAEIAPVKSRGKYIGIALLFDLPFSAAQTYGTDSKRMHFDHSPIVLLSFNMAMGRVDFYHSKWRQFGSFIYILSPSA